MNLSHFTGEQLVTEGPETVCLCRRLALKGISIPRRHMTAVPALPLHVRRFPFQLPPQQQHRVVVSLLEIPFPHHLVNANARGQLNRRPLHHSLLLLLPRLHQQAALARISPLRQRKLASQLHRRCRNRPVSISSSNQIYVQT